jgi:hypothetical protein
MRRGDAARDRVSGNVTLINDAGDAASRVSTEDSLVRTGRRGSRRRFFLDRQQLYAAPRTTATQQSPANNFHGRHVWKSHGEIFFP